MPARLALAALVVLAIGCRTPSSKEATLRLEDGRTVEGLVEEVARDDGTLTLRVGDERREVLVALEAEIRIDDFRGSFEDIKEGQRVRASLEEVGGQTEGFRFQILDHGATAPAEREDPDGASADSADELETTEPAGGDAR
jgi:hypothetical protein